MTKRIRKPAQARDLDDGEPEFVAFHPIEAGARPAHPRPIPQAVQVKTLEVPSMKLRNRIEALRKTYPRFGPARYLHATREDLRKRGKAIVLYSLLWSDDGRASLHKTEFSKDVMTVGQWAEWLQANVPEVLRNNVLAYVNRTFGSLWSIERIVGWHFASDPRRVAARKRGRR